MPTRDGRLSVKEILLRSALPALEAAANRRRRGRSASWEVCAAIFECLDGDDDGAITIEEFRLMADLLQIEAGEPRLLHTPSRGAGV